MSAGSRALHAVVVICSLSSCVVAPVPEEVASGGLACHDLEVRIEYPEEPRLEPSTPLLPYTMQDCQALDACYDACFEGAAGFVNTVTARLHRCAASCDQGNPCADAEATEAIRDAYGWHGRVAGGAIDLLRRLVQAPFQCFVGIGHGLSVLTEAGVIVLTGQGFGDSSVSDAQLEADRRSCIETAALAIGLTPVGRVLMPGAIALQLVTSTANCYRSCAECSTDAHECANSCEELASEAIVVLAPILGGKGFQAFRARAGRLGYDFSGPRPTTTDLTEAQLQAVENYRHWGDAMNNRMQSGDPAWEIPPDEGYGLPELDRDIALMRTVIDQGPPMPRDMELYRAYDDWEVIDMLDLAHERGEAVTVDRFISGSMGPEGRGIALDHFGGRDGAVMRLLVPAGTPAFRFPEHGPIQPDPFLEAVLAPGRFIPVPEANGWTWRYEPSGR